jgi:ribosome-associated translation inhibitor RaiA
VAIPLQISYRDAPQSDALDRLVAHELAKLERYFPRIVNCRVLIEHSYGRNRAGAPYHLRIELNVPGHEIVINHAVSAHEPLDASDKDPAVAVRTAFKKAKRQLQDYARLIAS